ncbi:MAG: glycoside hydrolase family 13 protein [Microscillaceae bacterium]|jgi:glycosidase|nr:glycoside hydrolase family 13 protein [Microscillaceae bacterium]
MKKLRIRFLMLVLWQLGTLHLGFAQKKYEIQHLEPAFWWAGMKNPTLQILVHAPTISELAPKIEGKGVQLKQIIQTSNPNYLFLNLDIAQAPAQTFKILFQKNNKTLQQYNYELKARPANTSLLEGYKNKDVIYLITPDRFANGNPNNDNAPNLIEKLNRSNPAGRHGGDLQGVLNHLDYIAEMGFTAIWLNPILENDMPEQSYHGYAITDFYKVDPRYGSNEEYKKLTETARQRGLKMVMDMVMNHCGSNHWWMKDLPDTDWFNYQKEALANQHIISNHARTTLQDIHASSFDKQRLEGGWFVSAMPDMNNRNPLLATYLIQNTIWWIEYLGLNGVRMDTYPYPNKEFMRDWTCAILHEYPDFSIVGEEWSTNPAIVAHWQRGKTNPNGYTSCLPNVMDFPLQKALVDALNAEKETWQTGMIQLYEALANDFQYANPDDIMTFLDNHDMDRFYTQIKENFAHYKMGVAYLLTMRGIPQVFYGTEILLENSKFPGNHLVIRSDMPGGWQGDAGNAFTQQGLTTQQKEAQDLMKKLLNWRKTKKVLHNGKVMHFFPAWNNTYVYFRYNDQEKVMVVMNKSPKNEELDLKNFREILTENQGKDIITGQVIELKDKLQILAQTVYVLELK